MTGETVFFVYGVCVTTSAGAVQTNGFVEKYKLAGLFPLLLLWSSAGSLPAPYRDGFTGCGLCVFDSEDSDLRCPRPPGTRFLLVLFLLLCE